MGEYLPSRDAIRPLLLIRIALGAREVESVQRRFATVYQIDQQPAAHLLNVP